MPEQQHDPVVYRPSNPDTMFAVMRTLEALGLPYSLDVRRVENPFDPAPDFDREIVVHVEITAPLERRVQHVADGGDERFPYDAFLKDVRVVTDPDCPPGKMYLMDSAGLPLDTGEFVRQAKANAAAADVRDNPPDGGIVHEPGECKLMSEGQMEWYCQTHNVRWHGHSYAHPAINR